MKTVVFDFDKTLTYKDSLTELFIQCFGGNFLLRFLYFCLKVMSKLGIISVKAEKLFMIKLLFKGKEKKFADACRKQKIQFTPIIENLRSALDSGYRVIVLSASACYLLDALFEKTKVEVLGTTFEVRNGCIKGICQHPFDKEKVDTLKKYGVDAIDDMYFDSSHDECLIGMSKHWHRVRKGIIVDEK